MQFCHLVPGMGLLMSGRFNYSAFCSLTSAEFTDCLTRHGGDRGAAVLCHAPVLPGARDRAQCGAAAGGWAL